MILLASIYIRINSTKQYFWFKKNINLNMITLCQNKLALIAQTTNNKWRDNYLYIITSSSSSSDLTDLCQKVISTFFKWYLSNNFKFSESIQDFWLKSGQKILHFSAKKRLDRLSRKPDKRESLPSYVEWLLNFLNLSDHFWENFVER